MMWTAKEIKRKGWKAVSSNYMQCLIVSGILFIFNLILTLLAYEKPFDQYSYPLFFMELPLNTGDSNLLVMIKYLIPRFSYEAIIIVLLVRLLVLNPLSIGIAFFFKQNAGDSGSRAKLIRRGFYSYGRNMTAMFKINLYTLLWGMLFIVPGIVKSYSYRMVPYLLTEKPFLPPDEAIKRSCQMMKGKRFKVFLYDLSFFGWALLDLISATFVGLFWAGPYKRSADAVLYLRLKEEADENRKNGTVKID